MKDTFGYHEAVTQLRKFFQEKKKFIEVPAQSRLSILAACEDPKNITQFVFDGIDYPLPQTGQMWLEYELLNRPDVVGFFCVTTSYRNEPHPIAERHDKVFPMFEFEARGGIKELRALEEEMLLFLGFDQPKSYRYEDICQLWHKEELDAADELRMKEEFGPVISLEEFPERTNPFWNMKRKKEDIFNKIDVILYGMETVGSAERAVDVEDMRNQFLSISDGKYAELLFQKFGRFRVMKELDAYLDLNMFQRFGGGIGMTRLVRAMRLAGLLTESSCHAHATV